MCVRERNRYRQRTLPAVEANGDTRFEQGSAQRPTHTAWNNERNGSEAADV